MCGTIYKALEKKVRKGTELKFYKVMAAAPVLANDSKSWTLSQNKSCLLYTSRCV